MKYLKTIVVLTLLIGFPLISYYYLNQGFNFRKDALESLKPKGAFEDICKPISERLAKNETSLIVHEGLEVDIDIEKYLKNVEFEFKDEPSFMIHSIPRFSGSDAEMEQKEKEGQKVDCNIISRNMILIDTAGMVRNYYPYTEQGFIDLMEDIAIVLPRKVQKDIIEKKYETQ